MRTRLQGLDTLLAPSPPPRVHGPRSDTQCSAHLGGALPFSRQQESRGTQCHSLPPAAVQQPRQEAPLPGSQSHSLLGPLPAYAAHHRRSVPLNGINPVGLGERAPHRGDGAVPRWRAPGYLDGHAHQLPLAGHAPDAAPHGGRGHAGV